MTIFKSGIIGAAALAAVLTPQFVFAQYYQYPYTQLQVLTQVQSGSAFPSSAATVTVFAPNASLGGLQNGSGSASFATNFQNETHTVTFTPGQYNITVSLLAGYTYSYSPGCQGTGTQTGTISCIITAMGNGSNNTIGTGQLIVNTNVNSYSTFGGTLPSNFYLTVSGNSPSPSSVPVAYNSGGSSVSLQPGYFSVNAPSLPGWTVTQTGTCQGYIQNGQSLTCTVNYSYAYNNFYGYNNYNNYNNGYWSGYNGPLACMPAYQTVTQGQNVQLTAVGGSGTYNWATSERNYQNIGPVLNASFLGSGFQTVVVTSGSQTASCSVNIVPPGTISSYTPTWTGGTINSGNLPSLPNTGFAPQNGAAVAFAIAGLLAAMVLVAPYVKRAFRILLP